MNLYRLPLTKSYLFLSIIITNFVFSPQLIGECPYQAPEVKRLDTSQSAVEQIAQIDEEIADLEMQKEKYLAKSIRFQDQGDRLQFIDDYVTEARRYWELSDCALEIVDKIDQELSILKLQRAKLLQKTFK